MTGRRGGSLSGPLAIVRGMTEPAALPLLFLDVDGTLIPVGGTPPHPDVIEDWDVWQSPENTNLVKLRPEHGRRLLAMPCELWWATAWMEEANDVIAPRIGLPELPVVDLPDWTEEAEAARLHWKTRTLVQVADGRPFIWIDDELTDVDREWVRDHHPGPALLQKVDSEHGVTEADLTAVEEWLRTV
jgi:hypothetical protein